MKAPSIEDRIVKVTAYLSDERFGYECWHAAQFAAPIDGQFAVLVICQSREEQDRLAQEFTQVEYEA